MKTGDTTVPPPMSAVTARRLAWGLAALAIALPVGAIVLYLASDEVEFALSDLLLAPHGVAFSLVGALVASNHPRNAIGWILLGVAMSLGLGTVAEAFLEYRTPTRADPGALAGAAAVYSELTWVFFVMVPLTFLLLLFPDGHLRSRRWRPIALCAGAGILGVFVSQATSPDLLPASAGVQNPFAVDSPVVLPLQSLSLVMMWIGIIGSVASVIVRFRNAGRVQRQQIKWLATAGAILAVTTSLDIALEPYLGGGAYGATTLAVLGLPVAVGIAILRHQLYDIDLVINRALVYGALTAMLAGTYLGSVLLLQLVLSSFTAGGGLAVAASTLAVAALFQPARRRIQARVDRRFFRSKYDAQRTLERFGARLRDEVELDALGDELRAVVTETMQPTHVTLWLRAPESGR